MLRETKAKQQTDNAGEVTNPAESNNNERKNNEMKPIRFAIAEILIGTAHVLAMIHNALLDVAETLRWCVHKLAQAATSLWAAEWRVNEGKE